MIDRTDDETMGKPTIWTKELRRGRSGSQQFDPFLITRSFAPSFLPSVGSSLLLRLTAMSVVKITEVIP